MFRKDPLVVEKVEQWQDNEFGLLCMWGPTVMGGLLESKVALVPESMLVGERTKGF